MGYDMMLSDKAHWFGEHPDGLRSDYNSFMKHYKIMADEAPRLGLEIINCTRQTALQYFPRMLLEDALRL